MPSRASAAMLMLAAVAAGACTSSVPTSPTIPVPVELLDKSFRLLCGRWSPSIPPVKRTVVDLTFIGESRVSPLVLETLRRDGAVVTYTFLAGRRVRAEIDIDRLLPMTASAARLWVAETVPNPDSKALEFIVVLDHAPTDEDVRAAQNLGGQVLRRLRDAYTVKIDDGLLPQLQALPGVRYVEPNAWGCVV